MPLLKAGLGELGMLPEPSRRSFDRTAWKVMSSLCVSSAEASGVAA